MKKKYLLLVVCAIILYVSCFESVELIANQNANNTQNTEQKVLTKKEIKAQKKAAKKAAKAEKKAAKAERKRLAKAEKERKKNEGLTPEEIEAKNAKRAQNFLTAINIGVKAAEIGMDAYNTAKEQEAAEEAARARSSSSGTSTTTSTSTSTATSSTHSSSSTYSGTGSVPASSGATSSPKRQKIDVQYNSTSGTSHMPVTFATYFDNKLHIDITTIADDIAFVFVVLKNGERENIMLQKSKTRGGSSGAQKSFSNYKYEDISHIEVDY